MEPNRVTSSPVHGRPAPAVLLAVLVSLALLVLGLAGLPAPSSGTPAATSAVAADEHPDGTGTDPVRGASMDGPESSLLARAAGLAAAPAPAAPAVGGLAPGSHPLVAPHLLGQPQARPPTSRPEAHAAGAPSSRAPPGPAGT